MNRNTSKSIALGARLRNVRVANKLSQRALAKKIGVVHSLLSRNESGQRVPTRAEVIRILEPLDITDRDREEILEMTEDPGGSPLAVIELPERRAQLAALVEVEQMAQEVVSWSPLVIPGLLQVSAYTRSIMEAAEMPEAEIATRVAVRMGRRDVLTRRNPVRFTALIGEAVLQQTIGGPEVMAEQFDHLLMMSAHENVELRIVPSATGWHAGLNGAFHLIKCNGTSFVHLENSISSVFVQEPESVAGFEASVPRLLEVAMSAERSFEVIAREVRTTGVA
ncbi:transcriptional regulator with XRE-family HTH domain [Saccharothrix saharensis]|uniref:Transcriptional regulator with XRE-family HTH domain n=1 Tax=Saccharothrix saharensis TaxID=571190 RepID=A0A543JCY1_9PSEU|nr:Scr1 family TA system antitoxin-like transcriptional regulator [Saccharothrix saharensis]TQM80631.1 transcriptional regulator with XRE-family HTH domain [Saccharothrix saharensis]